MDFFEYFSTFFVLFTLMPLLLYFFACVCVLECLFFLLLFWSSDSFSFPMALTIPKRLSFFPNKPHKFWSLVPTNHLTRITKEKQEVSFFSCHSRKSKRTRAHIDTLTRKDGERKSIYLHAMIVYVGQCFLYITRVCVCVCFVGLCLGFALCTAIHFVSILNGRDHIWPKFIVL